MHGIRAVLTTVVIAGAALAASPSQASADDVFLRLDGIDGESQDRDHRGWIEVQSMSWGTTTSGSTSATPPEGVRAVTFTRRVDAASPRLAAARTRRIPSATLTIRPAGSSEAQQLALSNVRVSSVRSGRTTGDVAMETVTITYEHIERTPASARQARALTARARTARARTVPGVVSIMALPGVDGQAAGRGHEGEIEILSWSWGSTASTGPQPETAPAGTTEITIRKLVDAASPRLSRARTQRTRLPEAVLTLRKAGGGQVEYIEVRLQNVMISNYSLSSSGSDGAPAIETVTFTFERATAPTPARRPPARRARARTTATR